LVRNNLIAVVIHLMICIITFFMVSGGVDNNVYFFFSILVSLALYIASGYFLSSDLHIIFSNKLKSFMAFTLVTFIGLAIWLITFIIDPGEPFSYFIWSFYLIYISSFISVISFIQNTIFASSDEIHPMILIWFSFLPMLLIWVGAWLKLRLYKLRKL
jgi:hypothetical protein